MNLVISQIKTTIFSIVKKNMFFGFLFHYNETISYFCKKVQHNETNKTPSISR